jgi:hypothetical protein
MPVGGPLLRSLHGQLRERDLQRSVPRRQQPGGGVRQRHLRPERQLVSEHRVLRRPSLLCEQCALVESGHVLEYLPNSLSALRLLRHRRRGSDGAPHALAAETRPRDAARVGV